MKIKFDDPRIVKINRRQQVKASPDGASERNRTPVPGSEQVSGIEVRMLPPLIKNNRTIKFWPFPGKAKLYCVTLVVSDVANQLIGHLDLNGFAKVGDGEYLPIKKTIFYWEKPDRQTAAPNQVHIMSTILKSKGALREAGKIMGSIRTDSEYQTLIRQLSGFSTNVAAYNTIAEIAMQMTNLIGRYLGRIEDRPIGAVMHSFTRLHGDWDELGVKHITEITDSVDFHFELVVRDEERYMLQRREVLTPVSSPYVTGGMVRL